MNPSQFPSTGNPQAQVVLHQAVAGCSQSRERCLRRLALYLRNAARDIIDSDIRGHFSASDLVQETLLAADRAFVTFQGESNAQFAAWLRRILANTLLNRYRAFRYTAKREASKERSIDAGLVPAALLATNPEESPSRIAIIKEEHQLLNGALEQLTDEYRRVIIMRHRESLTFSQIGQSLGRSPDAVRMLWYRAFQQLSAIIESMTSADEGDST